MRCFVTWQGTIFILQLQSPYHTPIGCRGIIKTVGPSELPPSPFVIKTEHVTCPISQRVQGFILLCAGGHAAGAWRRSRRLLPLRSRHRVRRSSCGALPPFPHTVIVTVHEGAFGCCPLYSNSRFHLKSQHLNLEPLIIIQLRCRLPQFGRCCSRLISWGM